MLLPMLEASERTRSARARVGSGASVGERPTRPIVFSDEVEPLPSVHSALLFVSGDALGPDLRGNHRVEPQKRNETNQFSHSSNRITGFLYDRANAGVCAGRSHGWNTYWWGPRFLNWGAAPGLPDPSPHQYTFHPWEIRTQTLYCALSRGCLADPVRSSTNL